MTKSIEISTIEHGLRRAIALLGDQGTETAIKDYLGIERSSSLFRKCADPDDGRHHLQLRYALALDVACQRAGHSPPILDVYRHLAERPDTGAASRVGTAGDILRAVIGLQSALGKLSFVINEALSESGPGGSRLTSDEKSKILEALEGLELQAEKTRRLTVD